MEKKGLMLVSMLVGLFTLFYMYFDYNGYLRYRHITTSEGVDTKVISEYSKLLPASTLQKVVVVVYAKKINERLIPCLTSLLDQTVRVNELVVMSESKSEEVANMAVIVPITYSREMCPSEEVYALVRAIKREREMNTLVIFCKKDVVYAKDFVERVVDTLGRGEVIVTDDKKSFVAFQQSLWKGEEVENVGCGATHPYDWIARNRSGNDITTLSDMGNRAY